jgi:WD40-like Beta Propeller Repeat
VTKARFFRGYIFFVLIVCSCSIEVNQTAESTPSPSIETTRAASSTSLLPSTHVTITWTDLNLAGKLIYLSSSMENNHLIASIQMLDLVTGEIYTIFSAPPGAWIYYATISPDAKQLVLSYAPPSQPGSTSNRALYILPLDASPSPQPLFAPLSPHDHYVQAEWSPDGKYIYYAHYNDNDKPDAQLNPPYDMFRMSYLDGQTVKIADHAFWPRVSSDSTKLVFVSLDPVSGRNGLCVANVDGTDPQNINLSGPEGPEIIDAPIFSPDRQSLLFSAPHHTQGYNPNWFEIMMGIEIANAHSVPSDWWSVPINGGVPTQLTNIQTINLFASLSPDNKHIASVSGEGLFVMNLDGSNLTRLISDSGVHDTVSWIP